MENQIIPKCDHEDTYQRKNTTYCRKCGKMVSCAMCYVEIPELEATSEIYYDDMKITLEHPVCRRCEPLYVTRQFLRLLLHMAIWPREQEPANVFFFQELLETAIANAGDVPFDKPKTGPEASK